MKEVLATIALACMSCMCLAGIAIIMYCIATGY